MRRTGIRRWVGRRSRRPPLPVILLLVVALSATLLRRSRSPVSPEERAGEIRDLHRWDLTGCWDLRVEAWDVEARSDSPSVLHALPPRVMLLPDSTDEWRRALTTYRAVPLSGAAHERLDGLMRWFVRADTLWLVWSDRIEAGAVALRPDGDAFRGSARATRGPGDDGATARASARKVNCATLLPEWPQRRRKR